MKSSTGSIVLMDDGYTGKSQGSLLFRKLKKGTSVSSWYTHIHITNKVTRRNFTLEIDPRVWYMLNKCSNWNHIKVPMYVLDLKKHFLSFSAPPFN